MKKVFIIITILILSLQLPAQSIEKFNIDSGGNSIIAGNIDLLYTIGEVNIQEFSIGNILLSEGFINSFDLGGTLSISEPQNDAFKIYPNPTSDYINISSVVTPDRLILYNLLGKMVLETTKASNNIKVDHLQSGIYILKIYKDNSSLIKKIIIK